MIEVQDNNDSNTRLIVTANQSMSWKANLYLAASLGVVCMGVAIAMAAYGLWMVIPFAGLEVIFIVVCLYLTVAQTLEQSVLPMR